jgi:ankyrin repeat protein
MASKATSKYVGVSNKNYQKEKNLLQAAKNGDLEKVEQLAAQYRYSETFLNQQNAVTGKTALILAAAKNRTKVVSFLCKHGADTSIHDFGDRRALDYARILRDKRSFVIIKQYESQNIKCLPR